MPMLLTADIHLDDNPVNEYRWNIFDSIREYCAKHPNTSVFILGDLSDRKDKHSGVLVNRLVETITRLAKHVPNVSILAGNHDCPVEGPPYWSFLDQIPNVNFYSTPTLLKNDVLVLPYSSDPVADWGAIADNPIVRAKPLKAVLLHQLVNGTIVNGREMRGVMLPDFITTAGKVWAGDIHDPQIVGPVEYVGAPHPVSFGDEHKCRFVVVDDNWKMQEEVLLTPPAKKIITIRSFSDLQKVKVAPGDQIRFRVEVEASKSADWPELERRISKWADKKGAKLVSTEALIQLDKGEEQKVDDWADPFLVLEAYSKENGVSGQLAQTGNDLLHFAIGAQGKSADQKRREGAAYSLAIKSVSITNFCSFGDGQEIVFPTTPGLRMITGVNEVDPDLEANGAGKTTLWEAISFAFYGSSSDGSKGPDLTREGQKRACVSVVLKNGDERVTISRWSQPNAIRINDQPATQEMVLGLVRLTQDQFFQAVLFGQGRRLFYDLSVPERDAFLNDVLGLSLWQSASEITATTIKTLTKKIMDFEIQVSSLKGSLKEVGAEKEAELQENSLQHQKQVLEKARAIKEAIEKQRKRWSDAGNELNRAVKQAESHASDKKTRASTDEIVKIRSKIEGIKENIGRAESDLKFYADNSNCPTCEQEINQKFRTEKHHSLQREKEALKKELSSLQEKEARIRESNQLQDKEWQDWVEGNSRHAIFVGRAKAEVKEAKAALDAYTSRLLELEKEDKDPYTPLLEQLLARRAQLASEMKILEIETDKLKGEKTLTQYWVEGFKKVRMFIAGRVLALLSVEAKTALGLLGLPSWNIEFQQERDTKSGTTKPGVHIVVTERKSARTRWSGGELQRVRLAVSLGVSSLIQRMAGVRYDLEVWDEHGTYLSRTGVENLFDVLAHRARTLEKSVWIIEHQNLEHPSILENWVVRKTEKRGSVVEMPKCLT